MPVATKSYYETEMELSLADLADLLGKVSELRTLHENGAATHIGYISYVADGLYEVGTLVIDVVDDSMLVFHRQTEKSFGDARNELNERVSRGY